MSRHNFIQIDKVRARRMFYYIWQMVYKGRNVLVVFLVNIVAGGLLMSLFDGLSILDGQYLAFITGMTIGYGDLSPESLPARVVAILVGINGLVLTGVIIAFAVRALELTFRDDLEEIETGGEDPS